MAAAQDAALAQFLSMTEDRVDPDVAQNLLEVVGWDVGAAMEQLYGAPNSTSNTRPSDAFSADAMMAQEIGGAGTDDALEQALRSAGASEDVLRTVGAAMERLHGRRNSPLSAQPRGAVSAEAVMAQELGGAGADDGLEQALRESRAEESLQRQSLREQQEAELAESILMDQMREQAERERIEAEKTAEKARIEEEQRAEQLQQQADHERVVELEAKKARLPEEPSIGEPGRVAIMVRTPCGQRLQRAFRASEHVGAIYDFLDVQGIAELTSQRYRLVSSMPRKVFEERRQTVQEAGIQNNFVLMVELLSGL